jgi:hypothetical protein
MVYKNLIALMYGNPQYITLFLGMISVLLSSVLTLVLYEET